MSTRCCGSSTLPTIFVFWGRWEFREPGAGSRNCPVGGNRGRGARRRRNKGLRAMRHHARDAGSPSGFVAPNRPAMPSGSRHHAARPDAISSVQNNTKTPGADNVSFWTPIIAPGAECSLATSHGKSVRSLGRRSGCCTACRPRGDPSDFREDSEAR